VECGFQTIFLHFWWRGKEFYCDHLPKNILFSGKNIFFLVGGRYKLKKNTPALI